MSKKLGILAVLTFLLLSACNNGERSIPTQTPSPASSPTGTSPSLIEPSKTPTTLAAVERPDYTPEFEAAECNFRLPNGQIEGETVDCGYLIVPEDRSNPDNRTLRLATAIFHPPGGAVEADPLIYLVGGPGASTLELLFLSYDLIYAPILESGRDLILFDQRGVGLSQPALDCPKTTELSLELLDNKLNGVDLSTEEADALFEGSLKECAEDLQTTADLSAYNSVNNAADVNDLHVALGYEAVNLWGGSYGTRLALGVMRDFPEGIRSVVLDSTYPPDVDIYIDTPANLDRSLNLLFNSCSSDPTCNLAYPALGQVFEEVIVKLNASPVETTLRNPLTGETYPTVINGEAFIGLIFQLLYETDVLPLLPKLIYDANNNDFGSLTRIWSALLIQSEISSRGMMLSVFCNEELAFSSSEAFYNELEKYPLLATFLNRSILGEIGYSVCEYWGAGTAHPAENEPVYSEIPTLVLQGEFDPITPPSWGERAAETLPNGQYFLFPGVGHGAVATECARSMLVDFVNNPNESPDSTCMEEFTGIKFDIPTETAADVELEPFTDPQRGLQGVVPTGWQEAAPGTFTRGTSSLDETVLLMDVVPLPPDDIRDLLAGQLGFSTEGAVPDQIVVDSLTWDIYMFEADGLIIDLGLAWANGITYLVLLVSSDDDYAQLNEQVFIPAINALQPIE